LPFSISCDVFVGKTFIFTTLDGSPKFLLSLDESTPLGSYGVGIHYSRSNDRDIQGW